jgi:hypothetical protein
MDNMGIVVDYLAATIEFFRELGLELKGQATIEGEWAGRVTGLGDQRVEIAMMRTPDGHGRLEISRFLTPATIADHRTPPSLNQGFVGGVKPVASTVDVLDNVLNLKAVDPAHHDQRRGTCHSSDDPGDDVAPS